MTTQEKAEEVFELYYNDIKPKKEPHERRYYTQAVEKSIKCSRGMIDSHRIMFKKWNKERIQYWNDVIAQICCLPMPLNEETLDK